MRQVLLIEDDEVKRQGVQGVLTLNFHFEVVLANSVSAAIRSITKDIDLIVADMSLPTYDIEAQERGGTPRPFGGIEVFEHLDRIASKMPVVVVTSYPAISDGRKSLTVSDLAKQLATDFPDNFKGLVYFDSAYTDWESKLVHTIRKFHAEE